MTISQLRELLSCKPVWLNQNDFDEIEVVVFTDNGIEQISETNDGGLQTVEAGVHFALVFGITSQSGEEIEVYDDEEGVNGADAKPELIFLHHESFHHHS